MKQLVRRVGDRKGENNPNWKGGVRKLGNYMWVYKPGHPRAVKFGKTPYVLRSIINLEKKLGRYVPKDKLAHHHTHKLDDRPSKLSEMSQVEHRQHHAVGKSNQVRRAIKKQTDQLAKDSQHENLT